MKKIKPFKYHFPTSLATLVNFLNSWFSENGLRYFEKLFKILQVCFPYLLVLTYFLLSIEVYTYHGIARKYLLFDSNIFLAGALGIWTIIILGKLFFNEKDFGVIEQLIIQLNRFITLPIILIYYFFISLEQAHYANYVYSQYHINVDNIDKIVFLNISVLILDILFSSKTLTKKYFLKLGMSKNSYGQANILPVLLLLFVSYFSIFQIQKIVTNIFASTTLIFQELGSSYQDKMVRLLGSKEYSGWVFLHGDFVNRNTPENAVIFIPPQLQSWEMEGNPWYFRWFVYPRRLRSAQKVDSLPPTDTTHILIAHGAWIWGATDFGWPKATISAEQIKKITLINRDTLEETVVYDQPYQLKLNPEQWGVIELKKD